ncbi:MAG: efflux RND transporter periplasmic adaptor subunit [Planctomycetaceae bacterium]
MNRLANKRWAPQRGRAGSSMDLELAKGGAVRQRGAARLEERGRWVLVLLGLVVGAGVVRGPLVVTAGTQERGGSSDRPAYVVDSALITLIEEAEVPARTPGLIQRIPVETGDLVAAKDLLVQLETADAELVVQRARHEVEIARQQAQNDSKVNIARKTFETAQRAVRRAEESNAKRRDSVTEAELDKLRLEAFTAESQIRQAETDLGVAKVTHELKEVELRQAELSAAYRRVVAPFAGMVVQLLQQEGEWAEGGKPLLRLVRLDRLRVEAFLKSEEVDGSLVGRACRVTVLLPRGRKVTVAGKVTFVSPEVNPVNGEVRVWAEVPNPELELRPGVQGRLEIAAEKIGAEKTGAAKIGAGEEADR